ncbi:hypothetical protein KSS87_010154 [Heliosperma pusillum]|nr:hypothetical protein KSS87_010154 [Heliosperma pusillum]
MRNAWQICEFQQQTTSLKAKRWSGLLGAWGGRRELFTIVYMRFAALRIPWSCHPNLSKSFGDILALFALIPLRLVASKLRAHIRFNFRIKRWTNEVLN